MYAQANMSAFTPESVAPPPAGFSDIPYQAGVVGQPFRLRVAAGTGTYADVAERSVLPSKRRRHPLLVRSRRERSTRWKACRWSSLLRCAVRDRSAKGELKWQVPHGDTRRRP